MMNAKDDTSKIASKEDLADFIDILRDSFLQNSSEWENLTMDRYLDAIAAWLRSMDNYYKNVGECTPTVPTWRTFADIMVAAKIYE